MHVITGSVQFACTSSKTTVNKQLSRIFNIELNYIPTDYLYIITGISAIRLTSDIVNIW